MNHDGLSGTPKMRWGCVSPPYSRSVVRVGWETDLGVCKILADEVMAAMGVYEEARCWHSTLLVTPTTGTLL